ncbi:unnamed protein product [Adineta ricciae]|uniref:Transmembrane protein n=1 Tax=Adineta ricciae TaxID=249248 RepID=A0A815RC56_ADIRI|nr:unnamed protein product [Adineta ricciae]
MNESSNYNDRFRPRAQSLFEARQRTNTELTISLLDRLISPRKVTDSSDETSTPTDPCEIIVRTGTKPTLFFIFQPLVAGFLVFPLLILFWQAGWNFMVEWLQTSTGKHWSVLPLLYCLAQLIFLFIYMDQDRLYDFVHRQNSSFFVRIILQLHNLLMASNYIVQWVSMWTIWDRYTSNEWVLMLIVSIAAILAVITIMGHPCDLVCAPFILSYDSIEYNIRIGTPFLTEKISERLAHFLNYIFYEFIMSLLSILAWRGSYTLLDVFLYPKDAYKSAGLSLCLGFPLYFLLMYTQSCSDRICSLPTFFYLNYPSLIRNIRHLAAFFACVLLWRGFWLLFDTYVEKVPLAVQSPYFFYLLCMSIAFIMLSLLRTASSINGPMSHMCDIYDLFPHYPNCYLICFYNDLNHSTSSKNSPIEPYSNPFL